MSLPDPEYIPNKVDDVRLSIDRVLLGDIPESCLPSLSISGLISGAGEGG